MTATQRRIRTAVRVGLVFAILTAGYVWALTPSVECATEDSTNCYWDANIGTDQSEIVPLTRKPKYFDNYHASALFDVFGEGIDVIRKREHGSTSGQADIYWTIVPA